MQTHNLARCSVFAVSGHRTSQQQVSACGAFFRRLGARFDRAKAITAVAHKLALNIYTLLTKGAEYTVQGQDYDEEFYYRQHVMHYFTRSAEKLGMQLVLALQLTL
jgi:hypothetical protein